MIHTGTSSAFCSTSWWRPQSLAAGEAFRYEIGPLALYVRRLEGEWLLANEPLEDSSDTNRVDRSGIDEVSADLVPARFVFGRAPAQLQLLPRLLDRPLVVKTLQRVCVPPGEGITFFISSPICVEVNLPELGLVLADWPVTRLSDTWFGPSTQEGELCYAGRTSARINRDELPLRPHRAVTPVTIQNTSDDMLPIEKLSIPLPLLALYGQVDGNLWTEAVTLQHQGTSDLARLAVHGEKPSGELLSNARTRVERGGFVRSLTGFFTST